MDRRKISRNLRASVEGLKIRVKSTYATPTSGLMEEQNPSIYEIDIFSSFEVNKNNKKGTDGGSIKMSLAKAAARVLEITREESAQECKILDIPLLESYYPTLQQTQSKVKGISFQKEKIDSEIQTDLNISDRSQEKEKKASKEKADKENQSPSEDFEEFLKSIIIENFILNDDSTMKILVKNLYEKMNKNQLHLHHHEHHHHYYFDNSTLLNENTSSFPSKKVFTKSQKAKSDGRNKVSKDRKCQKGKDKTVEKGQPTHAYYFKCPRESNLTFTKTSSGMILKSESKESSKAYKIDKIKEKKSSATFESSRLRFSSSDESILTKKSDFITTHIYSDTELKKCDSEILHMMAISEFEKGSSKESKKNRNNDYSSMLNDLKNLNHFISPSVIADQVTAPQISYVRCECASLENSSTMPNGRPFYDINISAANMENQENTHSERKSDEDENIKKVTERPNSKSIAFPWRKNEEDSLGQYDSEAWTATLKTELKEIKKELKRIEEKHLHKGKSLISILNDNELMERPESSHNVTVYSSKTFIVGPDSLYVTHEGDREQYEEEIQSVSKIRFAFQGAGNERERWHYREKRSFFERTVLN